MADPFLNQDFHFGCWNGHSISHPQFLILRSAAFSPGAFLCRCQAPNPTHRKNRKPETAPFQWCRGTDEKFPLLQESPVITTGCRTVRFQGADSNFLMARLLV